MNTQINVFGFWNLICVDQSEYPFSADDLSTPPTTGVLCNSECPDELNLGDLSSNSWHIGIKLAIAALVVGLALCCVIMKVGFVLWLQRLEKKQRDYLQSLDDELESTDDAILPVNT